MRRAKRILSYVHDGRLLYRVDMYVRHFDGSRTRYREFAFRTIEEAQRAVDLKLSERFAPPKSKGRLTVREAWNLYNEGLMARGRPSSAGRFQHLDRYFGNMQLVDLHPGMIDAYRVKRRKEHRLIRKRDPESGELRPVPRLRNGTPYGPSDCSLDHDVKLLHAVINHAVRCRKIAANPIAGVKLLNTDNVRTSVISEADFARLHSHADDWLKPILVVAYDTGMRRSEIMNLRWDQVDLDARKIFLRADDTKAHQARIVHLTERARSALTALPKTQGRLVFAHRAERSPSGKGRRWAFARARVAAGLPQIWFHDLRRSFVTNARKRGVPESVVMKMSGHRTRNVFARYNIIDDADLREAVKKIEQGQREAR